jgi:cytochrome c-type biogenesis protein CcmH/NrfG
MTLNNQDAANRDALSLIELAPGRPEGYCLLGSVAGQSGNLEVAVDALKKAAELAAETGQIEMEVTAPVLLSTVLQQLGAPSQ